jgi:beta-lactamase class D
MRILSLFPFLLFAVIAVCCKVAERPGYPGGQEKFDLIPGCEKYFRQYDVKGAFVMYELKKGTYTANDTTYFNKGFLPGSTFKIFNSLVALETGVIADEHTVFKWDGKERMSPAWNKDTDLEQAFKNSTVWYYQELARKIGEARMQEYINKAGYGNGNISGGIDYFWLGGELRITPSQQIGLLTMLYKNELPFSQRTMDIVKRIMIAEQTEKLTLRGKTGWVSSSDNDQGWYVGYLEREGNVYFFATIVESTIRDNGQFAKSRVEITRSILKKLGLL